MSQAELILRALRRGHKITPLYALQKWGCFRLSARILELRQEGWPIQTEKVNGKPYARYSLVK